MYRPLPHRRSFGWADLVVLSLVAAILYGFMRLAQQWTGVSQPNQIIELSPFALPKYTFFSFTRASFAYLLSFAFSLVYGYIAAKSAKAERVLIPFLDILQCIPVLGFLPGLVLGLVSIFPNSNIGIELACILMIFTSQAWNMCFSFYSSVKSVPHDLAEISSVIRLSWWKRVQILELPFAAIGLAWNSLMSMAGGWFFLTVCESFSLGSQKFRLPGLGSYMAVAIEEKNTKAMAYGILAMSIVIIVVDFLIWRPIMAWVKKFQMDEIPEEVADLPFVTSLLRDSWVIQRIQTFLKKSTRTKHRKTKTESLPTATLPLLEQTKSTLTQIRLYFKKNQDTFVQWLERLASPVLIIICLWGATRVWELVRLLSFHDWKVIWGSVGLTFLRVFIAVVAGSLWTIPVAITIGLSPRLTRIFQPFVQVVASFPAPMIYPLVVALMRFLGIKMHLGASILMLIGIQWYILFNVLAGASSVTRDLKDTLSMIGTSTWSKWKTLYLPSAFPSLVTGWITAAGGAWNASIVAEYVQLGNETFIAKGIGSMITKATAEANFPLLAGSLLAMVATVVGLNQTFWKWLSDLAENRFKFDR
jgi:NitT/TauT family transport system permease protein